MKKVYQKPDIVFESFTLSTNIAAGCEFITDQQNVGGCGYMLRNGDVVFMDATTGCLIPAQTRTGNAVDADGTYVIGHDSVCYHVPAETYNVFNS